MIWEKIYLDPKSSPDIGVKLGEWENFLIKDNISLYVYTPTRYLEAFVPFMHSTISKEDTTLGSESKFISIVRSHVWPTRTPKSFKEQVVQFFY
jgi:hypothetical protein